MTGPSVGRRSLVRAAVPALAVGAVGATASPARALPRATVRARRKFFGDANVDRDGRVRPDRVVVSWFGCMSYAVAMAGEVFLLDAWVPRGTHSGYVPTDVGEVADLRPSDIHIGHGHFDHARDAGPLAAASGARVVGTREHTRQAREFAGQPIRRRVLGTADDPYGTVHHYSLGGLDVTAIKHPHSAPKPPDPSDPHAPLLPPPDPTTQIEHPPRPEDLVDTCSHAGDEEGGVLLYQFRARGFRLLWHDSVGPVKEEAPQVPALLRRLPRTDLHIGAIQGFGQVTNGMRDVRSYVEAAAARVFVPGHHDDWGAPVVATQGDGYRPALEAELAAIPARRRPRLRWMRDPRDYVRPERLTFRI